VDSEKARNSSAAQGRLEDLTSTPPPPPSDLDPTANFRMFIEHGGAGMPAPTLQSLLHHLDTAWQLRHQPNVAMFHYADYQQDLVGEMERLAGVLGVAYSRARLAELAPEASLDRMRDPAPTVAPAAGLSQSRPSVFPT